MPKVTAKSIISIIVISVVMLTSANSCVLLVKDGTSVKKDSGKHRGWTKNKKNPHHPFSENPGKREHPKEKH